MQTDHVKTDSNLREYVEYQDAAFPFGIWTDIYNTFKDYTLNCHWHNAFEFGIVVDGFLDYWIGDTHMKLRRGDCIFVNSNVMHMAKQTDSKENAVMFAIVFEPSIFPDGNILKKYFQTILEKPIQGCRIDTDTPLGRMILQNLRQLCELHQEDFGYELKCIQMLSQIWLDTIRYLAEADSSLLLYKNDPKHEALVKEMLQYIHQHFMESISIAELSNHVHVSASECFRSFRRYTGKSPVEYINEYRLTYAARLLADTNLSISEICTACGFCSSSYFGKLFKAQYEMTPLRYRKKGSNSLASP